jgi:hypothetical protein
MQEVVLVAGSRSWQAIDWQTWTAEASPELVPVFPNRFSELRYRVSYAANHSHAGDCNWRETIGH